MQVKGLNGKEYKLKFKNNARKCSKYHSICRSILDEICPGELVYEEVFLPGSGKLTADFFLPKRSLIIEVNGEQHYKYVQHFHGSKLGFLNSQKRDVNKKKWCDINNIRFLELDYNDTTTWRNTIYKTLTEN